MLLSFFSWTWDWCMGTALLITWLGRPVAGNKRRCSILCHFPRRALTQRFITTRRKSRRRAITVYHCWAPRPFEGHLMSHQLSSGCGGAWGGGGGGLRRGFLLGGVGGGLCGCLFHWRWFNLLLLLFWSCLDSEPLQLTLISCFVAYDETCMFSRFTFLVTRGYWIIWAFLWRMI